MSTLEARTVQEDGQLGGVIATATRGSAGLVHSGGNAIEGMLAAMAASSHRTELDAFDLLIGEPWSNGKIWIGAAAE